VVYEDVMDAKQACDKLNGFNFQNRYLVGTLPFSYMCPGYFRLLTFHTLVLYHQPEKMAKSREDLEARRESLAQLKKQHGID
jgi:pre-mRNA branch site protein p14